MEVDLAGGRIWFKTIEELHQDRRVPHYFRARMSVILHRDGCRDGTKRVGVRKLFEQAFFRMCAPNLSGNSKEFGMSLPWEPWQAKADEVEAYFNDAVREIIGDHQYVHVQLEGWCTGYHAVGKLSTTPCAIGISDKILLLWASSSVVFTA
mmetsp:Transcript_1989/g.4577  ORF Transcript_1989/g.4577 Transcript_1989/m.4577 type:complete len:151 (-) Transcript_1989:230-682(-)